MTAIQALLSEALRLVAELERLWLSSLLVDWRRTPPSAGARADNPTLWHPVAGLGRADGRPFTGRRIRSGRRGSQKTCLLALRRRRDLSAGRSKVRKPQSLINDRTCRLQPL